MESYFKDILKISPTFAVFLGDHSKEHLYENPLDEKHMARSDRVIDKYRSKCQGQDLDSRLLRWIIDIHDAWKPFEYVVSPLTSFENPIVSFTFMNRSLYSSGNPIALLKRQKAFVKFIKDCKARLNHPDHHVLPRMICEKLIGSMQDFIHTKSYIVDSTDATYVNWCEKTYRPLLEDFVVFLKDTYLKKCRKTVGLCKMPNGKALYKLMIKSNTTLDYTPDEIHEFGLKEVAKISRLLKDVKTKLGFPLEMSLQTFLDKVSQDSNNNFSSRQEVMKAYKDARAHINNEVITRNFHKAVKDYEIKAVPKEMEKNSAGAFYMPGNGKRPGTFYLNTRNVDECHKYSVLTLSLHEGNPGHHYQFQYMIEQGVPKYRQYVYHNTAFVEGWALYAETLMDLSKRPYDMLGRLTYDMFRAVRLVVDTGIHWKGWSYEKAVAYMMKHLAMSQTEIETEVQRYICIPAQALCYKLGEREILRMRGDYLAHNPSIKDFHHDILMEGTSVPLWLLKEQLQKNQAKSMITGA